MMVIRVLWVRNAMKKSKIICFDRTWLRTFRKSGMNGTALAVNKSPVFFFDRHLQERRQLRQLQLNNSNQKTVIIFAEMVGLPRR